MPGRLFLEGGLAAAAVLGLDPAPEEPVRRNIRPGEALPVLTDAGWRRMRWGMIPVGRVNARVGR